MSNSDLAKAFQKFNKPHNGDDETEVEVVEEPKGKTTRMIDIGRKGIKLSREHIHAPIQITIAYCPDCGKVVGGENTH